MTANPQDEERLARRSQPPGPPPPTMVLEFTDDLGVDRMEALLASESGGPGAVGFSLADGSTIKAVAATGRRVHVPGLGVRDGVRLRAAGPETFLRVWTQSGFVSDPLSVIEFRPVVDPTHFDFEVWGTGRSLSFWDRIFTPRAGERWKIMAVSVAQELGLDQPPGPLPPPDWFMANPQDEERLAMRGRPATDCMDVWLGEPGLAMWSTEPVRAALVRKLPEQNAVEIGLADGRRLLAVPGAVSGSIDVSARAPLPHGSFSRVRLVGPPGNRLEVRDDDGALVALLEEVVLRRHGRSIGVVVSRAGGRERTDVDVLLAGGWGQWRVCVRSEVASNPQDEERLARRSAQSRPGWTEQDAEASRQAALAAKRGRPLALPHVRRWDDLFSGARELTAAEGHGGLHDDPGTFQWHVDEPDWSAPGGRRVFSMPVLPWVATPGGGAFRAAPQPEVIQAVQRLTFPSENGAVSFGILHWEGVGEAPVAMVMAQSSTMARATWLAIIPWSEVPQVARRGRANPQDEERLARRSGRRPAKGGADPRRCTHCTARSQGFCSRCGSAHCDDHAFPVEEGSEWDPGETGLICMLCEESRRAAQENPQDEERLARRAAPRVPSGQRWLVDQHEFVAAIERAGGFHLDAFDPYGAAEEIAITGGFFPCLYHRGCPVWRAPAARRGRRRDPLYSDGRCSECGMDGVRQRDFEDADGRPADARATKAWRRFCLAVASALDDVVSLAGQEIADMVDPEMLGGLNALRAGSEAVARRPCADVAWDVIGRTGRAGIWRPVRNPQDEERLARRAAPPAADAGRLVVQLVGPGGRGRGELVDRVDGVDRVMVAGDLLHVFFGSRSLSSFALRLTDDGAITDEHGLPGQDGRGRRGPWSVVRVFASDDPEGAVVADLAHDVPGYEYQFEQRLDRAWVVSKWMYSSSASIVLAALDPEIRMWGSGSGGSPPSGYFTIRRGGGAAANPQDEERLARRSGPALECDSCGERASHSWGDDFYCRGCIVSGMEHGHRHVHDEPGDCATEARRLADGAAETIRCPRPVQAPCRPEDDEIHGDEPSPNPQDEERLSRRAGSHGSVESLREKARAGDMGAALVLEHVLVGQDPMRLQRTAQGEMRRMGVLAEPGPGDPLFRVMVTIENDGRAYGLLEAAQRWLVLRLVTGVDVVGDQLSGRPVDGNGAAFLAWVRWAAQRPDNAEWIQGVAQDAGEPEHLLLARTARHAYHQAMGEAAYGELDHHVGRSIPELPFPPPGAGQSARP